MRPKKFRHLDLFSGIGGFALAASWVWQDDLEIVAFCEKDKFCQKVLKKHWPDVPIIEDIYNLKGDEFGAVDIVSGGPPCQPASVAGKRRGTGDDRWLWDETIRVTKAFKPTWCLFENPTGILSLQGGVPFENLLLDLEAQGYEVQAFIVPAVSVNAPHRRDRVWICAAAHSRASESRGLPNLQWGKSIQIGDTDCHAANAGTSDWGQDWYTVATRTCIRNLDDGLSRELARHRIAKLKALGNAIVPQVAAIIMNGIKDVEKELQRDGPGPHAHDRQG